MVRSIYIYAFIYNIEINSSHDLYMIFLIHVTLPMGNPFETLNTSGFYVVHETFFCCI